MHDDHEDRVDLNAPFVAVIDDDENILAGIRLLLTKEGTPARTFSAYDGAAAECARNGCALVVLDMYLGAQNGHEILKAILADDPLMPVIMISGLASPEEAARAIRAGAFDFIEKPFSPERMLLTLRNALRYRELNTGIISRAVPVRASQAMRKVCATAAQYARSAAPVLLTGESGCGKDLVSALIHSLSPRADKPFVKINCGAIPKDLADSELFGHARGSFTGAERDYPGRVASADGGTLFLDEVAELPPAVQVKLLRFLETGELQRIGDATARHAKARVIAATNIDLERAISEGNFRKDLFFRLNVLALRVPPLRDRKEDIVPIARWYLDQTAARDGKRPLALEEGAIARLEAHDYPGNVRELRNIVERMYCMAPADAVSGAMADEAIRGNSRGGRSAFPEPREAGMRETGGSSSLLSMTMPFADAKTMLEKAYLAEQFGLHGHSVKDTAEALGILPNNLSRRMKQLGIT